MAAIAEEFVDYNELRVAPPKEIADAFGKDHPHARRKAVEITSVLNAIFGRRNTLSLEHVTKMTKRELRRHLAELGLSPYAAACLVLKVYAGHAIPVDRTLVECLEIDKCVEPGSEIEDVQGFLERSILQKDALAAHEFFREHIEKSAAALARKRKADAAKAAAEAAAREKAEAEAAAKAEAEAAAKAAAKAKREEAKAKKAKAKRAKARKAKAKKARAAKAKAAAKAAKKSRKKKTAKPAAPKAAKRARKPAAKKATKAKKAKKAVKAAKKKAVKKKAAKASSRKSGS
jgi:hypothetical protein